MIDRCLLTGISIFQSLSSSHIASLITTAASQYGKESVLLTEIIFALRILTCIFYEISFALACEVKLKFEIFFFPTLQVEIAENISLELCLRLLTITTSAFNTTSCNDSIVIVQTEQNVVLTASTVIYTLFNANTDPDHTSQGGIFA
jgi:hypothetical protein